MLGKKLINSGPISGGANTFASENFNTVLYTGNRPSTQRIGGYINRGAVFNGSSSKIDYSSSIIPSSGGFSISWWMKWNGDSDYAFLFDTAGGGATNGFYCIVHDTIDEIYWNFKNGSYGTNISVSYPVSERSEWTHFVITWDGTTSSNTAKIYKNNVATSGTQTVTQAASGQDFKIGYTGSEYFNGSIDQVRIFDKELSSSEVTTLYGETFASASKSVTDIFSDSSAIALYQLDGNANDTGGVSGKFGSAAIFNGSSSYIDLPLTTSNLFAGKNTFTLSLWFNTTTTGRNDFFNDYAGTSFNQICRINNTGTAGNLYFSERYSGGTTSYTTSGTAYNDGVWHNVIIVFNNSNNTKTIYIDGSLETTYSVSSNGWNSSVSQKTVLGAEYGGSYNKFLNGKIDDVRIYSDVLTLTEVGYIYNNNTASIPTDNLTAYYKLDGDARDEQQLYDGTATNVTYAYDGTATNVTYQEATNFSPDLIWIKNRDSSSYPHVLTDSVRGNTKYLQSNSSSQELTSSNGIISFDNNGFSLGNDGYFNGGASGANNKMVAWCFNAGEGAAATNNDGVTSGSVTAVTSQVKANQDAGFSICEFTTPSSGKPSWGHGLSQAPELIIVKNAGSSGSWFIYAPLILGQKELRFTTAAAASYSPNFLSVDTSKIDLGSSSFNIGVSSRHINYNFHSVDGYQKIGSYTGTGAAGNFIETGFEPAFVLAKPSSSTGSWLIMDNKRGADSQLYPNLSSAEYNDSDNYFYSNGFEMKSNGNWNTSGVTFIYLAIAADPDTTTPTVENSFDVVTYTGNGGTQDLDFGFKPDLVWIKNRSNANPHSIQDAVTGDFYLRSNATDAAAATGGNNVSSFNSNGITVKDSSSGAYNVNGSVGGQYSGNAQYVAWVWKAADHDDNLPQINTEGSIDSVVSVNAEAGFSIVKYTGTGSNASFGHGLSSLPELVIVKRTSATEDWFVLYDTTNTPPNYMKLNTSSAGGTSSGVFPSPATSTVVSVGNDTSTNSSGSTYIAYCFHSVTGYQKIGSYTGNGGTLSVTTEFAPRFVILKPTSLSDNWMIYDTSRGKDIVLFPNLSNADTTYAGRFSFLSDGFQLSTSNSGWNGSGETYIYLAIK